MSKKDKKSKHKHVLISRSRRFAVEVCKEGFKENDPICITIIAESGKKAHHHFTYEQASAFVACIETAMERLQTKKGCTHRTRPGPKG